MGAPHYNIHLGCRHIIHSNSISSYFVLHSLSFIVICLDPFPFGPSISFARLPVARRTTTTLPGCCLQQFTWESEWEKRRWRENRINFSWWTYFKLLWPPKEMKFVVIKTEILQIKSLMHKKWTPICPSCRLGASRRSSESLYLSLSSVFLLWIVWEENSLQ